MKGLRPLALGIRKTVEDKGFMNACMHQVLELEFWRMWIVVFVLACHGSMARMEGRNDGTKPGLERNSAGQYPWACLYSFCIHVMVNTSRNITNQNLRFYSAARMLTSLRGEFSCSPLRLCRCGTKSWSFYGGSQHTSSPHLCL